MKRQEERHVVPAPYEKLSSQFPILHNGILAQSTTLGGRSSNLFRRARFKDLENGSLHAQTPRKHCGSTRREESGRFVAYPAAMTYRDPTARRPSTLLSH